MLYVHFSLNMKTPCLAYVYTLLVWHYQTHNFVCKDKGKNSRNELQYNDNPQDDGILCGEELKITRITDMSTTYKRTCIDHVTMGGATHTNNLL